MKRSIIALIMALAMILTLVACGNSNGDNNNGGNDVKAIQLSLGHTNNTDHHYQVLAESFKKIVEEKSNGQLIINIFPAEQLGSGSEMLESVKSGTQDMVLDPDAYLANYDPLFNVIAMPYGWYYFVVGVGAVGMILNFILLIVDRFADLFAKKGKEEVTA